MRNLPTSKDGDMKTGVRVHFSRRTAGSLRNCTLTPVLVTGNGAESGSAARAESKQRQPAARLCRTDRSVRGGILQLLLQADAHSDGRVRVKSRDKSRRRNLQDELN